jgi:hypothetical protein
MSEEKPRNTRKDTKTQKESRALSQDDFVNFRVFRGYA